MVVTSVRRLCCGISAPPRTTQGNHQEKGKEVVFRLPVPGRSLPSASPGAYLSGMEKELRIRLLEELKRAWVKCLPGLQAAARNELMRALPTELARRSSGH